MDKFFYQMHKLKRGHLRELTKFCGAAALLLLFAGFIAGGGTARIGNSIAQRGTSPQSQTAAVFPCSWFGDCGSGAPNNVYDFYAAPSAVVAGQPTTLVWTAARGSFPLCQGPAAVGKFGNAHCYIYPGVGEVYNGGTSGSVVVYPSLGSNTYSFCSQFIQDMGGSCLTTTVTATAPKPATPTINIDAGAGPGVTRTVAVGTPVTIVGTFTASSGDTITRSSLVDYQTNALPGISTAVPPTTKTYVFTPTDAGSYIFYPSVQTNFYPGWNNYGKSVMVNVTQPVLGPCNDIPLQISVPSGCVNPSPSPGVCTPIGGSYSSNTNTCSCPAGQHVEGTTCVKDPLCANGLNDSYAPSCKCPSGQYQPLGSTRCVVIPVCANGLDQSYSPSCTCPSGQVQVTGGTTCVLKGSINSFTVNPSRVLQGRTATVSWSTSHMSDCSLSAFNAAGTTVLSTATSATITPVVNTKTIYTLTCTDASNASYSSSVTVSLIPQTIEQ
jgi:hypothetical protein